jgi:hypothetical protein
LSDENPELKCLIDDVKIEFVDSPAGYTNRFIKNQERFFTADLS